MKTEIDPKEIARALAIASDEEQGAFFNEFGQYLVSCCNGKHHGQLCHMIRYLDHWGVKVLQDMARFADLAADGIRERAEWAERTRCQKRFDDNEPLVQQLRDTITELESKLEK